METLQLLATALGLSALSGINLYLTVFATSLALNLGWLHLSPELQQLQVLASPGILVISGILYFVEFFTDKIPGIDSLWDTIHTAIRPLGAAFLTIAVLGETDPAVEVAAVLLGSGVALTTHATKAGIRAIINTSPEPISNAVASVTEDVMVAGGVGLVFTYPMVAMALTVLFVVAFIYFAPKLFRHVKAVITFVVSRLFSLGKAVEEEKSLGVDLPEKTAQLVASVMQDNERIRWSVKALTGKMPGIGANRPCHLILLEDANHRPTRILFHVKGKPLIVIGMDDLALSSRSTMLFHEITLTDKKSASIIILRFTYGQTETWNAVIRELGQG